MTQKDLENIMKLIEKDEKENKLEDLIRLRDYLTSKLEGKTTKEEKIFMNPLLESKKEILLTPMEDYFGEIKQIGPPSATYPLSFLLQKEFTWKNNDLGIKFAVERREQQPGQPLVCLAHFIQLEKSDVRNQRGIGEWTLSAYEQFLEEKGLSFGTEISREENQRIAKYLIKTTQPTINAPYRVMK